MSTEIVAVNIQCKKQLDKMQTRKQLRILMATIPVCLVCLVCMEACGATPGWILSITGSNCVTWSPLIRLLATAVIFSNCPTCADSE